jgi:hypothetical protein
MAKLDEYLRYLSALSDPCFLLLNVQEHYHSALFLAALHQKLIF